MRIGGLAAAGWLSVTGCLADPPTYEAPAQIPPVVNRAQVDPPLSVIYQVPPGVETMEVTVPFRSEDLGSRVVAKFLIDAEPGRPSRSTQGPYTYDPSNFDDQTRQVNEEVSLADLSGCHTVTLLLSNSISFGEELTDESLATGVTWFIAVLPSQDSEIDVRDCPTLGQQIDAPAQ